VVSGAVEQVLEATHREVAWYERLRVRGLEDAEAKTVLIDALRAGACTTQQLQAVIRSYFEGQGQARTAWGLYNAFTDAFKDQHAALTLSRSRRLNSVFAQLASRN
jgi:hypothetical protein